ADDLSINPSNLPADGDKPERFILNVGWIPVPQAPGAAWSHPSPVHYARAMFGVPPSSLTLSSGDTVLDFDGRIAQDPSLEHRWMLVDDTIYLASHEDPASWPDPPVLSHAPAAEREAAWNLVTSGADLLSFALRRVELDQVSHPCLYLPAPSRAELNVDVPAQGASLALDLGLALPTEASQSTTQTGDATASLVIRVGEHTLDRTAVTAGAAWTPVRVDLTPWAGQQVTVTLASEPDGDPTRDYLCVGDPRLVLPAPQAPDPVHVVVVCIDTLRADHLGVNGYSRDTSPHLDALAQESVLFDWAWSPAPRTRPSFRTSTTGRWPLRAIGATDIGQVLADAGFSTAGIVANVHLAPRLGFAKGFQHYSYDNGASADVQVDRALAWLGEHRDMDSFLFLHLMDPHIFYLPPEPYRDQFTAGMDQGDVPDKYNRWMVDRWQKSGKLKQAGRDFIEARYDGEIAFTDAQLGRLFEGLDELPGRTLLVVHTDHGEEFWDHDGFEHNHTLYDELTRTVLWIRPPGGRASALRRDQPVSLADLAPTLYQALGLPQESWPEMDGRSLWDLVDPAAGQSAAKLGAELDARPLHQGYLMFDTERWSVVAPARDPVTGALGALHKYVLVTTTGEQHLFNLESDPGEQHDLARARHFDPTPWAAALAQATDWPVGPGWRLKIMLLSRPLTLVFDQPVSGAGVIDPEASRTHRANLEWGETPVLSPEEVATVTVSDDGRTVQIVPGSHGKGTVYILGPTARSSATLGSGGKAVGPGALNAAGVRLTVQPGIVIAPTETEQAALAAVQGQTGDSGPSAEQVQALRSLGYLE
ncbi:MAG: sulfatase, partial [Oligoflexia bacterium]|nr:sulfatase [Oligoflexia bacterium]